MVIRYIPRSQPLSIMFDIVNSFYRDTYPNNNNVVDARPSFLEAGGLLRALALLDCICSVGSSLK